jgi:ribosomal protein S18 acetylase RimI-like enzyme
MNVQVVERVPERHRQRVAELLALCFGVSTRTEARRREHEDRFCSQADVWRHVLALDDAELVVGFATVYRRGIERARAPIVLGGLGDVCTHPDWRRRGIATALARAATAEMARVHCDMAYLCAAVDDPGIVRLYGQCGFVPLRRPHTFFGRSGRLYEDHDAMIAPIASRSVFEEVRDSQEPFHIGTGNW